MRKLKDKHKLFLIVSSVLILPLSLLLFIIKIRKINHKNKTANKVSAFKPTKILSLEGISKSITLNELYRILNPGGFKATACPNHLGNKNYAIEYKAAFNNIGCEKKFIFTNDLKLKICNYTLYNFDDILEPQGIYEEISNSNGIPDTIYFDKEIFLLQCTWYGQNGVIIYNHFYRGTIAVVFKLYIK